jgi:hypothetical protein
MGDTASALRWTEAAIRVREHFAHDFFNPTTDLVADHLTAENEPDFTLRPNMLFALDLIGDEQVSAPALRKSLFFHGEWRRSIRRTLSFIPITLPWSTTQRTRPTTTALYGHGSTASPSSE